MKAIRGIACLSALLTLGASPSVEAGLFGLGGTSWKEEVLLHDGKTIIVERYQTYGGRREIGQALPIKEHTLRFDLPVSGKSLQWTSEYSDDLGRTNFNPLALHVLADTPYLVAEPNLCLSYNKWGRPNPPYVVFKHDGTVWQRIPLSELPQDFKTINLIVSGREEEMKKSAIQLGFVPVESVRNFNSRLTQPEYQTILREPLKNARSGCGEMVYDGRGGWTGIGWFKRQPSLEACLKYCEREKVGPQYCPCETLFGGNK